MNELVELDNHGGERHHLFPSMLFYVSREATLLI